MASPVPVASAAIKAAPQFIKYGTGVCGSFSLYKEIVVATGLGIGLGLVWKVSRGALQRGAGERRRRPCRAPH
jgi:hypothetical protein